MRGGVKNRSWTEYLRARDNSKLSGIPFDGGDLVLKEMLVASEQKMFEEIAAGNIEQLMQDVRKCGGINERDRRDNASPEDRREAVEKRSAKA
jgi:hypothetical protein